MNNHCEFTNPCIKVINSSQFIVKNATHIKIDKSKLDEVCKFVHEYKYDEYDENSCHPVN